MSEDTDGGRPARKPYRQREKAELRAAVHEAVQEFTHLRRDKLRAQYLAEHPNAKEIDIIEYLDEKQPLYDEFDPVVELAVLAADHRNEAKTRRQAMSDAAPYLRPKLKQIEHLEDPETRTLNERKNDLAEQLLKVLFASSTGRSSAVAGGSSPAPQRPAAYEDDSDSDEG